jgi:ubiquinone/menaquinone biosynthesis C-methylase UbiE
MNNCKKKVYDKAYGYEECFYEPSHGLMGFLYKKLRKREINRYQVTYDLLPPIGESGRLLDVGCGDGDLVFICRKKFGECYGIDISKVRIERARKRALEKHMDGLYFYECDADEGLPFSDSFFDAVTCIAVLEHVFNPPNVVNEIHRVLKPNGFFIVQVPNVAWFPYRIQLLFGKLPKTGGVYLGADWEHLHWFTKDTLVKLLLASGFQIKQVTCSGIFAKFRKYCLSLLSGDLLIKAIKP